MPTGRIAALTNIVSDGRGGAVIVWEDLTSARQVGDEVVRIIENEMWAQRVDSLGQLAWDKDGIAIRTKIDSTTISDFALVTSNHTDFITVWTDDRSLPYPRTGPMDFYAQKVDLQGNLQWQTNGNLVTVHGPLQTVRRRVVADGAGGFFLARFGEGNQNTVLERISSDGELLWQPGGVPVHTGGAFELDADEQGGAVIAGVYVLRPRVGQVRVQRVNSSGQLLWGDSATVIMDESDLDTTPRIVSDNAGGAYLYWDAKDNNGARKGFIQHFDNVGLPSWPAIATRYNVTSTIHPIFISDGQNGVILLAIDFFETPQWDFWAVKVLIDGIAPWGINGVLFRKRPFNDWPFFFDVLDDGSGGFIGIWSEFYDETLSDVVLQQVSANGNLGEVITSVHPAPSPRVPDKYSLLQNYPNPFNPETEIRFMLRDSGLVSLVIYDLTGKEVVTLFNGRRLAGEHRLTWNGRDHLGQPVASGVYFYRLQVNEFQAVRKMIYLH